MRAGYDRLRDYLFDMILEEQLKLGYEREMIRFYSPAASVSNILACGHRSGEEIAERLSAFGDYVECTLGAVDISLCSGDRICFLIPADGARYVHEHCEAHPFLVDLIQCFAGCGVTRQKVLGVFGKWSENVRCIHIGSDEFDDVLYFEDGRPDAYRYCVKFDDGHAFYHRFLKEDFEEFLGEEK